MKKTAIIIMIILFMISLLGCTQIFQKKSQDTIIANHPPEIEMIHKLEDRGKNFDLLSDTATTKPGKKELFTFGAKNDGNKNVTFRFDSVSCYHNDELIGDCNIEGSDPIIKFRKNNTTISPGNTYVNYLVFQTSISVSKIGNYSISLKYTLGEVSDTRNLNIEVLE